MLLAWRGNRRSCGISAEFQLNFSGISAEWCEGKYCDVVGAH